MSEVVSLVSRTDEFYEIGGRYIGKQSATVSMGDIGTIVEYMQSDVIRMIYGKTLVKWPNGTMMMSYGEIAEYQHES